MTAAARRRPYDAQAALAFQLRAALPRELWPTLQHRFAPPRRWTFDFAFLAVKLAVEVDGGLFIPGGGGHTRGAGREDDMEKDATALTLGWRVLRVSPRHVRSGAALFWVERLLQPKGAP